MSFRVDRLEIVDGTFGFVNKTTTPAYRVSVDDTALTLTNLSSLPSGETATASLTGTFTGGGRSCGGIGFSYRCLVRMPIRLSASNGTWPVAISYRLSLIHI